MALALITGATGAIGQGIAEALARDGRALALVDRDFAAVQTIASRFKGARAYAVDLTRSEEIDALVAHVEAEAPIAALVNAAGGFASAGAAMKPFLEQTPTEWRTMLDA